MASNLDYPDINKRVIPIDESLKPRKEIMYKKLAAVIALSSVPMFASAQWVSGVNYSQFDWESVSLGVIGASIGYKMPTESAFSVTPQFRLGMGISDDSIGGVDVEIDTFMALSAKGQYDFSPVFYGFIEPSYGKAEMSASGFGDVESDWEFGIGGGVGYSFTDFVAAEVQYETYDETDVLSLNLRFSY